jgi:hypothetical protein
MKCVIEGHCYAKMQLPLLSTQKTIKRTKILVDIEIYGYGY